MFNNRNYRYRQHRIRERGSEFSHSYRARFVDPRQDKFNTGVPTYDRRQCFEHRYTPQQPYQNYFFLFVETSQIQRHNNWKTTGF